MSRFLEAAVAAVGLLLAVPATASAQDAAAGEKVFARCKACHAVGEGAKNRAGPHLNDVFGRSAGTVEGFKYSKAMTEAGAGGLALGRSVGALRLGLPGCFDRSGRVLRGPCG